MVYIYIYLYLLQVLLSGCSAGGQGVVVNVDYFGQLLKEYLPNIDQVQYKALADAGNSLRAHIIHLIYP